MEKGLVIPVVITVYQDKSYTSIRFKPATNIIRIDRTQSGLPCDIVNVREFPVFAGNGELKLRLIMDRYSLEVFINVPRLSFFFIS